MTGRPRRFRVAAVLLAGLPLAATVAAFMAGVSIDASRWRDRAAVQASAALGLPVEVTGALRLTLGRELTLRIGGLRIPGPAGFEAPALLSIDEARIGVGLFDLLRGAPRLRRVEADDVALWLERAADGRANWTLPQPQAPGPPTPVIDVDQIGLKRVAVHYVDRRGGSRRDVDLETLSGRIGPNGSLDLSLQGRGSGRPALRLGLTGGPLQQLQGGTQPWPFKLDVRAPDARLQAGGVVDARLGEARFAFDATVDDPARAGRWLGLALPPIGMVSVRGSAKARPDAVAIDRLQGTVPGADFSGQLAFDLAAARPRLQGAVQFGDLDLGPWRAAMARAGDERPEPDGAAWQAVPLRGLAWLDARLDLSVARCFGLPLELRDARLALRADAQGLRAPVEATVAGARLSGRIDLDTVGPSPALALRLTGDALPLGGLALWAGAGVDGTLGHFDMQLGGRGETLGAWVQDLRASVAVSALDARVDSGRADGPVALRLEQLKLLAGRGERVQGSARGSLRGERVSLSLRAGRLPELLRGPARPIELALAAGSARLRIATDLAGPEAGQDRLLSFDFQAARSGDLARWLGVAADSALPVAARGRLRLGDASWQLDTAALQLGRSDLTIDASGLRSADAPGLAARVRSAFLDVVELATLAPVAGPARAVHAPRRAPADGPADADLALELQQVLLGRTVLRDVGLSARIRQGRLLPSPLRGRVAGMPFDGAAELDLRAAPAQARLELSSRELDLGPLLHELGVAERILDGRADSLQLTLQGQGRDWRTFVEGARLQAHLTGGQVSVRAVPQRPVAEIRLHDAALGAAPGEPLRMRLDGALGRTPLQIELSSGTLADLLRDRDHLPFALAAQAAGTRLTLDGEVALPLGRDADLRLQISGERLDTLGELSGVELPAWGPWSIAGPIRMTPDGYDMQGLQMQVGQSRLGGSGRLDLSGPRPHLALQVSAPSIQLDDFPLPPRLTDPPDGAAPAGGLRRTASELAGRTDRLLSARFLRRVDASIDVQAKEVLAGTDRLADGALRLRLREGRLDLDPAVVNLPGGSLRLSIAYDLKESELDFALAAAVERFDYGIIARRLRRADDLRGLFSLNMRLQGRAPSLDTIMRHADGTLDVAVWPNELRAGVFNFWSVNLVLTMLPMLDPRAPGQVNCMVGRFDLKDGLARYDKIVIDTTAIRIQGAGQANLATEELGFVFRPRAKSIGLFRLQNPLHVTGTLSDQRIGFERRDTVESVLRLIASPILWPIERFTLGPLPRDGADVCTDPLRAAGR